MKSERKVKSERKINMISKIGAILITTLGGAFIIKGIVKVSKGELGFLNLWMILIWINITYLYIYNLIEREFRDKTLINEFKELKEDVW